MKGIGYVISCFSVALLMIPPLKSAKEDPLILFCLLAGAALSIVGMHLRWLADRKTQHRLTKAQAKGEAALRGGRGVVAES
ncbi:MAG TPA: hypothetical protein VHM92_09510 [Allosphingosinicella sp.]|nr:hypothetical protein [Allosphingosinicella sp.]